MKKWRIRFQEKGYISFIANAIVKQLFSELGSNFDFRTGDIKDNSTIKKYWGTIEAYIRSLPKRSFITLLMSEITREPKEWADLNDLQKRQVIALAANMDETFLNIKHPEISSKVKEIKIS